MLHILMINHSYLKEWKLINGINLYAFCMIKKHVIHIRSLRPALNNGLKKLHRVIRFNQEAWLKPYIDILTWILN